MIIVATVCTLFDAKTCIAQAGNPGYSIQMVSDNNSFMVFPGTDNTFTVYFNVSVTYDTIDEAHAVVTPNIKYTISDPSVTVKTPGDKLFPVQLARPDKAVARTPYSIRCSTPFVVTTASLLKKDVYITLYIGNDYNDQYVIRLQPGPNCCAEDPAVTCDYPDHAGWTQTKDVIFDFKLKKFNFPNDLSSLKRGDAIRVKVINYNPFLYQVNINGTDSTSQAVVDNNNLLNAFTNLTNLGTVVGNLAGGPAGGNGASFIPPKNGEPPPWKPTASEKPENQEKLIKVFVNYYGYIGQWAQTFRDLKNEINLDLYTWDHYFAAQRYLYPTCNDFAVLWQRAGDIMTMFKDLQIEIGKDYTDVTILQTQYFKDVAAYNDLLYDKNYPLQSSNRFQDSIVQRFFTGANANFNICDSLLSYKVFTLTEESMDRMKDVTPTYTSLPLFLTADSKVVTVGFSPWSDSLKLPSFPATSFELPWAQQYVYGINAGVYIAHIPTKGFSAVASDTSTTGGGPYTIVEDDPSKSEIGINAMAYLARKLNKDDYKHYNYLGASFGAAMSISSTPKPRFMAGVTFVHGRTNRLVVTFGGMGGYSTVISSGYSNYSKPGMTYVSQPTNFTKSGFASGYFLSFGYSFIN